MLECGLGARGFALAIGDDPAVILTDGDAEIPGGRFAEMILQKCQRLRSEIRAGPDAEALHLARGDRSDAVELPDRQRRDEVPRHIWRDDELTIGFALTRRKLGEK